MKTAYKYRLYPNKSQSEMLDKTMNVSRWAFNYCLSEIKKATEVELERRKNEPDSPKNHIPTNYDISRKITELKKDPQYAWLNEVPRDAITHALENVDKAFKNFFRRLKNGEDKAGYPKFKKKGIGSQSFALCSPSNKVDFAKGRLSLLRIPNIKAVFHRHFEGFVKTITVTKDPTGAYYASILVDNPDVQAPQKREVKNESTISVHSGLRNLFTTSEGVKYDNPRTLNRYEEKLKRLQRRLSKLELKYTIETNEFGKERRLYSKNRDKLRLQVNKLHKRIANIREWNLHNISKEIVENDKTETICMDKFNIKDMVKDTRFAKNIHDAAWYKFKTMVKYKAEWLGKNVLETDFGTPITQRCFVCKSIEVDKIPLNKLEWVCSSCGITNDRDLNAAQNVRELAFEPIKSEKKENRQRVKKPKNGNVSLTLNG